MRAGVLSKVNCYPWKSGRFCVALGVLESGPRNLGVRVCVCVICVVCIIAVFITRIHHTNL